MSAVLRSLRPRLFAVLALAAAVALGALLPSAFGREERAPTAVRNALAQTSGVQGAPGRTMVLSRVTVPPGVELALHHRPPVDHLRSAVPLPQITRQKNSGTQ